MKESLKECLLDIVDKGIDWKSRYFQLKNAVDDLADAAEYNQGLGSLVPTEESWGRLEKVASHYSQDVKVDII